MFYLINKLPYKYAYLYQRSIIIIISFHARCDMNTSIPAIHRLLISYQMSDVVSRYCGLKEVEKNWDLGVAVRICRMKSPAEFAIRRLIDGMGYR